jgi:hypothetical protein
MPLSDYEAVGFIGLGVMGYPMAAQLATKLPIATSLYVYDISQGPVDRLCKHETSRVHACTSAAEVAGKSVGPQRPSTAHPAGFLFRVSLMPYFDLDCHHVNGSRGLARSTSLSR